MNCIGGPWAAPGIWVVGAAMVGGDDDLGCGPLGSGGGCESLSGDIPPGESSDSSEEPKVEARRMGGRPTNEGMRCGAFELDCGGCWW